jgi:hypothetical protein
MVPKVTEDEIDDSGGGGDGGGGDDDDHDALNWHAKLSSWLIMAVFSFRIRISCTDSG